MAFPGFQRPWHAVCLFFGKQPGVSTCIPITPFTEKQDVFQLPDFAAGPYSVICDFDGTVTPFDVTDAILERFARPA